MVATNELDLSNELSRRYLAVSAGSLADAAYAEIKRHIVTLKFKPGEYLNEGQICEATKMTKAPVHQALQRLKLEGLVQILPRKGIVVQPVTIDEVIDVIDVRYLNEPCCVERATAFASDQAMQEMSEILAATPSLIAARDVESLMYLDRVFHNSIARAAGNEILTDLLSNLHDRSLRFWVISLSDPERMKRVENEHLNILEAMKRRDAAGARQAMEDHIQSFRATITERVK